MGEVAYVSLKQAENGLYIFAGAFLDRPADGIFLHGRIVDNNQSSYRIKYGIDALFAAPEKALKMERDLADEEQLY